MYHLIFSLVLNLPVIRCFGDDNNNQAVMYDCGTVILRQIVGMSGCILTTSDFREPAVLSCYLH